jgi:hypothetical protein
MKDTLYTIAFVSVLLFAIWLDNQPITNYPNLLPYIERVMEFIDPLSK